MRCLYNPSACKALGARGAPRVSANEVGEQVDLLDVVVPVCNVVSALSFTHPDVGIIVFPGA